MIQTRLESLIQSYIDLRLTAAERAELEQELLVSHEARQLFWKHLQFDGAIHETVDAQQVRQWMTDAERSGLETDEAARRPRARGARYYGLLGLAAAAMIVMGFFLAPRPQRVPEPTSNGVAILTGCADVCWSTAQTPLEPGSILAPGRLQITSGLLGIEFYSGARITLQGPADIDLVDVDQMVFRQGRIRVHISDRARGFKVSSPKLDIVDLGTEFGMEIGPDDRTELHVFNGRVELAQVRGAGAGTATSELVTGQGLRIDKSGVSNIPAQSDQFAGQSELNARLQDQTRTRYAAWQEASRTLRADPRVVLYYDFQPANREERSLLNGSSLHGHKLDGTVVGANWTDGRWPGKSALEFRNPDDRVRVFVPGEYDTLTLVSWLRVDAFHTTFAPMFLTDGYFPGAVHWQFYEGKLRLSIAGENVTPQGRLGHNYDVKSVEPAAVVERWRQVAVVIDMLKREVVHYLDGRAVYRAAIAQPHRLVLGKAELGNWGLPDTGAAHPIRNFNGRMDEFVIFNQALTDAEITAFFDQGRPWPGPVISDNPNRTPENPQEPR